MQARRIVQSLSLAAAITAVTAIVMGQNVVVDEEKILTGLLKEK